jgi:hypothetical protein
MKTQLLLVLLFLDTLIFAQIINDNFDTETVGILPTGWIIKYNGSGDANQKVVSTTSVSPDNSFELEGNGGWSATLYNIVEQQVYQTNKVSFPFDISFLKTGVYVVKLVDVTGVIITKKNILKKLTNFK